MSAPAAAATKNNENKKKPPITIKIGELKGRDRWWEENIAIDR